MPLCKTDKQTLDHKKACLLMATAACIQMARSTDSRQDMVFILNSEFLWHCSDYRGTDYKLLKTDGRQS